MGQKRKNVFLFLCHLISKETFKQFGKIVNATKGIGDAYLLFHLKERKLPSELVKVSNYQFTDQSLACLGYSMINTSIVPGSNHFPALQFFLDYPDYDFYWLIEYDVRFSGDWRDFFRYFAHSNADLLTCDIRSYIEKPNWSWWELKHPSKNIPLRKRYASFNPIYRISNRGLKLIDRLQREGWSGHHEVLLPTLLYNHGLRLRDFGGNGKFVKREDKNRFYLNNSTKSTVRWRPPFKKIGTKDQKLYHPVKPLQDSKS